MTIPARHIGCAIPVQQPRTHDKIFKDLVYGMADMDITVGVRWAVMQDKGRALGRSLLNLLIQFVGLELSQHFRFALGQRGLHRKIRLRQVDGVFVIH